MTTPNPPRVGIVLVNYNGLKFMPDCLRSLAAIDYPNAQVVVVDNASTDGSAEWTAQNCPEVALVRHGANLGITGGNNAGMEWCLAHGCDYVLLLNNDTVVEPDFLSRLIAQTEVKCLLVPKIFYFDNRSLINNHLGGFDYWRGIHRDWFYGKPDTDGSRSVRYAGMANTCALLMPAALIGEIGVMDDNYFIYCDDTDFITRAVRHGWRVKFVPDAVLYHQESSSSGGKTSPLSVYYTNRNRMYFMRRHQRNPLILAFFVLYYALTRLLVSAKYLARGQRAQARALRSAVVDFLCGRMGQAPAQRYRA